MAKEANEDTRLKIRQEMAVLSDGIEKDSAQIALFKAALRDKYARLQVLKQQLRDTAVPLPAWAV